MITVGMNYRVIDGKQAEFEQKFDVKHFRVIERLAMVGDRTWEKWMATFCRPFTTAATRYFDRSEADEACKWIEEAVATPPVPA